MNSSAAWSSKSNRCSQRTDVSASCHVVWLVNVYPLFCSVKLNCSRPWIKDRFMSPDIEAVHRLLIEQKVDATFHAGTDARSGGWSEFKGLFSQVWDVAKPYIDKYQMEYIPESRPISPTAFSLEPPASPRKRVRVD